MLVYKIVGECNSKYSFQSSDIERSRNSHRRCSIKKVLLKFLQNSQESTCIRSLIFNKIVGLRPRTLVKKESGTDDFMSILQTF